jgi:hypothetical protein
MAGSPFARTGLTNHERSAAVSMQYDMPPQPPEPSGWATGGLVFAGTILTLSGIFQAINGIAAIANDNFFVKTRNYAFNLDVTAWGWIHLLIGIAVFAVGLGLFSQATWAGVAAVGIAMLSAIANFFFIPHYPIWSLVVIGLDIWVIWALTRPGVIRT